MVLPRWGSVGRARTRGARAARAARQPHAILVVDDETAIRESLELTLGDDYRVFTAATGEEGLAILERENDRADHHRSGAARR